MRAFSVKYAKYDMMKKLNEFQEFQNVHESKTYFFFYFNYIMRARQLYGP